MIISTDTYTLDYDLINDTTITNTYDVESYIFVHRIRIEYEHQGKGIATRILTELQKKYEKPMMLLCYETLKPFYEHIGFYVHELCEDDYYIMRRDYGN